MRLRKNPLALFSGGSNDESSAREYKKTAMPHEAIIFIWVYKLRSVPLEESTDRPSSQTQQEISFFFASWLGVPSSYNQPRLVDRVSPEDIDNP